MFQRFLVFILFLVLPVRVFAAMPELETSAKQAVVVDFNTGQVLFSKNADKRMPTSSMSKVMTMIVVFDALKSGAIKLDDTFLVSEKAWRKGGSKMFVGLDTRVSVEDLIRGVIVQSGNDATIVLAEGLAGSEEAFAERLNEKAQEIGMVNSQFRNASGWPDPEHYSTAKDLALMAGYLIRTYPEYYKYYSEESFTYNNIEQQNRNPLLYRKLGADGIKTGHTEVGGYGLIGTGVRDGRRVTIVVNGLDSEKARAQESGKILEWGLARFEIVDLFSSPTVLLDVPVVLGKGSVVSAETRKMVRMTMPKGMRKELKFSVSYQKPLVAPVAEGDDIGTLQIILDEDVLAQLPLRAKTNIKKSGMFSRTFGKAKQFIKRVGSYE